MLKLEIKPSSNAAEKTMRAVCKDCGRKICEATYESLTEFRYKTARWRKAYVSCPFCKAVFRQQEERKKIEWHHSISDYSAEATNGTFFVWKWGHSWRWSFKYNNEDSARAENTGVAYLLEVAQRICEKHKEWK